MTATPPRGLLMGLWLRLRGLSNSNIRPFAVSPAVPRNQLCQPARSFSLRGEFTPPAVLSRIFPLRVSSNAIPMMREIPPANMSEVGRATSHSVLGMVGRRLVLRLRRRENVASGSILRRSCCFRGHDPRGENLHTHPSFSVRFGRFGLSFESECW